jgi:hypothetical protein
MIFIHLYRAVQQKGESSDDDDEDKYCDGVDYDGDVVVDVVDYDDHSNDNDD